MASKTKTVLTHAKHSFQNRYGIKLTDEVYRQIVKLIQDGKSKVLQSQGNSVVHAVEVEKQTVVVVYRQSGKQIVTALPPECLDPSKIGVFI